MTKLNLQFALGVLLLVLGVAVCVDALRVEARIEESRLALSERRARLAALPELLALPGNTPAEAAPNDALRDSARLGQARIAEQESAIERDAADARSRVALGRLALVTGTGVLLVAWLNFRRRLTAVAAQA